MSETRVSKIFDLKQKIREIVSSKETSENWPKEREGIINGLREEYGQVNFCHAIRDLKFDAWANPTTKGARFIAKAAEMCEIPFGKASQRRLQKK